MHCLQHIDCQFCQGSAQKMFQQFGQVVAWWNPALGRHSLGGNQDDHHHSRCFLLSWFLHRFLNPLHLLFAMAGPKDHCTARVELVKASGNPFYTALWLMHLLDSHCPLYCVYQAFLMDLLEDDDFLDKRRKLLRQRAGLSSKQTKEAFASEMRAFFQCCIAGRLSEKNLYRNNEIYRR